MSGNCEILCFPVRILLMWQAGINAYWMQNSYPSYVDECIAPPKDEAKQVPIKLMEVSSAYVILGIGSGLTMVIFVVELLVGHAIKRNY